MQRLCLLLERKVNARRRCAMFSSRTISALLASATAGRGLAEQIRVDAVVLNADAFGNAAFDALRVLVEQRCAPVIVLATARDEIDQILALELGAADFIAKPASPRFVVAKVKR